MYRCVGVRVVCEVDMYEWVCVCGGGGRCVYVCVNGYVCVCVSVQINTHLSNANRTEVEMDI